MKIFSLLACAIMLFCAMDMISDIEASADKLAIAPNCVWFWVLVLFIGGIGFGMVGSHEIEKKSKLV